MTFIGNKPPNECKINAIYSLLQSMQLKAMTAQNMTVDGDQYMMLNFKFAGGGSSDVMLCLNTSMHKVEHKFSLQKLWS